MTWLFNVISVHIQSCDCVTNILKYEEQMLQGISSNASMKCNILKTLVSEGCLFLLFRQTSNQFLMPFNGAESVVPWPV